MAQSYKQRINEYKEKEKTLRRAKHHVRLIGERSQEELDALAYNIIAKRDRMIESGELIIHQNGGWEFHFKGDKAFKEHRRKEQGE